MEDFQRTLQAFGTSGCPIRLLRGRNSYCSTGMLSPTILLAFAPDYSRHCRYQGEIGFFDNYIIPFAKKLKDCRVFGVSSEEYLDYAVQNRAEWEERGQDVVRELVQEIRDEEAGDQDGDDEDEGYGDDHTTEKVFGSLKSLVEDTIAEESIRSSSDLQQLLEGHASLDISAKVKMLEEKHTQERKDDDSFISNLETDLRALQEATTSRMSFSV